MSRHLIDLAYTHDARSMARIWSHGLFDQEAAARAAKAMLAHCPPERAHRLRALSAVLEAIQAVHMRHDSAAYAMLFRAESQVLSHGDTNAVLLVNDARAIQAADLDNGELGLRLIEPTLGMNASMRESWEWFWTHRAAVAVYARLGQFNQALAHALRARQFAHFACDETLCCFADQVLSYIFISVGDIARTERMLRFCKTCATRRCAPPNLATESNLTLALCLLGQPEQAELVLNSIPETHRLPIEKASTQVRNGIAMVHLGFGRCEQANTTLGDTPPSAQILPQITATWHWIKGHTLLALGRPDLALPLCENLMDSTSRSGQSLSPINTMQTLYVMALAHRALGNTGAADTADQKLRASQFEWTDPEVLRQLHALDDELHLAGATLLPPPAMDALQHPSNRSPRPH